MLKKEAPSVESFESVMDTDSKIKYEGAPNDPEAASSVDPEDALPFHAAHEGEVEYRTLGLWGTSVLLVKTQLGLGILAIPSILATLGVVPGVLLILIVSAMTCWSNYVIGTFKVNHPAAMSMADVGMLIGGKVGREVFGGAYCILLIASVAAAFLGISIGLVDIIGGSTCSIIFVLIAMVITLLLASIQTLGKISFIGWAGVFSIMVSVLTLTIAVGVVGRPNKAPETGEWERNISIVAQHGFTKSINAVSQIVFAFAGTPIFLNIASEMKSVKRDFTKAVLISQAFVTTVYIVIGLTVYLLAGQYVSSPALGTAGDLMNKICYGLALPGLMVTATIITHVSAKYLFVRILRTSRHLCTKTKIHYILWFSSVIGSAVLSFLLAAAIPIFSDLISLVGASIGSFLVIQIPGVMWLFDNWTQRRSNTATQFRLTFAFNIFLVAAGGFMFIAGSYGAVQEIIASINNGVSSKPFGCSV